MVCNKIKNLSGKSRRDFLRLTTAMGAVMALDQAEVLNVIADCGGTALAQSGATKNMRSVHLVAGDGGFAWFQLLWPHTEVAKSGNGNFAYHAMGQVTDAPTDKASVWGPATPWQTLGPKKQISAFMAGVNQTHTATPGSAATIGAGQGMIAAVAAIQRATPSLLPVIGIEPVTFGAAPGAPGVATVGDADGLVQLFNSSASRLTLEVEQDAALFEAYYKAYLGLVKAAGRPTWTRHLNTGKSAANFLGKNLASLLAPSADDLMRYQITDATPSKLAEIARTLITAARAFKLGLTQSVILPAMRDDPHGAWGDLDNTISTANALCLYFNEFMADLKVQDPLDANKDIADNVVLTVHGDTPKTPLDREAWQDGTPDNSNWLYVMGNGYLKTGWFGGVKANGSTAGFDPTTGNEVPNQPSSMTSASAGAAVAYAVAKGDMNRVKDFYTGPAIDGMVNLSVL